MCERANSDGRQIFGRHHVNASPLWLTLNAQPWISTETKVRVLEWKIRMDLMEYAARGCPPLSLDSITSYKPKDKPEQKPLGMTFHHL